MYLISDKVKEQLEETIRELNTTEQEFPADLLPLDFAWVEYVLCTDADNNLGRITKFDATTAAWVVYDDDVNLYEANGGSLTTDDIYLASGYGLIDGKHTFFTCCGSGGGGGDISSISCSDGILTIGSTSIDLCECLCPVQRKMDGWCYLTGSFDMSLDSCLRPGADSYDITIAGMSGFYDSLGVGCDIDLADMNGTWTATYNNTTGVAWFWVYQAADWYINMGYDTVAGTFFVQLATGIYTGTTCFIVANYDGDPDDICSNQTVNIQANNPQFPFNDIAFTVPTTLTITVGDNCCDPEAM